MIGLSGYCVSLRETQVQITKKMRKPMGLEREIPLVAMVIFFGVTLVSWLKIQKNAER